MDLGLGGKVAVVTGASRGIGRAIVEMLVEEGVTVVAGARDVSTLDALENVAAGRLHFEGVSSITDEDWQWALEINLLSAVRAALPHLLTSRGRSSTCH